MPDDNGARASQTSRRGLQHSRQTAAASRRTVLIALFANAAVMLAKLVAGVIGGSAAILAEAAHSLADTANQCGRVGTPT